MPTKIITKALKAAKKKITKPGTRVAAKPGESYQDEIGKNSLERFNKMFGTKATDTKLIKPLSDKGQKKAATAAKMKFLIDGGSTQDMAKKFNMTYESASSTKSRLVRKGVIKTTKRNTEGLADAFKKGSTISEIAKERGMTNKHVSSVLFKARKKDPSVGMAGHGSTKMDSTLKTEEMLKKGMSVDDIAEKLDVADTSVYSIRSRMRKSGILKAVPKPAKHTTGSQASIVADLAEGKSPTALAKKYDMKASAVLSFRRRMIDKGVLTIKKKDE